MSVFGRYEPILLAQAMTENMHFMTSDGKIMALPHRELYVLKIVSDNLDEADCEAFEDEAAWEQVRALLIGKGLKEKRLG